MTGEARSPAAEAPLPVEIHYDRARRALTVAFADGERFVYSAEYLRVHSPSAEVRGHAPGEERLQIGKEAVAIDAIEPVGLYAVRLRFDDGHDTGLYSWDLLHALGRDMEANWQRYVTRLRAVGVERNAVKRETASA